MAEPEQAELDLGEETTPTEPAVEETEVSSTTEPTPEPESVTEPDQAEQLQAQLDAEREQRIRLEERDRLRSEQSPPAKEEPPKELSRAQLRAAVAEGTIDEDQMEEFWSTQQHNKTLREMESRLDARDQKRITESFVETETLKYVTNFPGVKQVGSPEWNRVKSEYDFMVQTGDPDNKQTELKALRAAFGPSDRIAESSASRRQTPSETSSGQERGGGGGDRPVDIWNRVPKYLREEYKRMVQNGVKTLEDVKKDIPYMKERPH